MEKMFFSEPQQRVTVGAYGKVLVLLNERKEKAVGDSMGDETREAVPTEQYVYDGCLLDTGGMASEQALLAAAKREVLSAISTYDASDSVNGLVVNGQRGWLDKATRVGLMNGVGVAKACGMERMSLWIDGREYVMDVARLEEELARLTWRREVELTGMNRQYDRLREKYIDVLQSRRKLMLRLRDAGLLTDEEKDILLRSADEGETV